MAHWTADRPPQPRGGTARQERLLEYAILMAILAAASLWRGIEGAIIVCLATAPLLLLRRRGIANIGPADRIQAFQDPVSGLPYGDAIVDALNETLGDMPISGQSTACLVIGLDDPGSLAELYGLPAHDQALRRMAERIATAIRPSDQAARLDGDRFAIALAPMRRPDLETLVQMSARLQAALQEPLSIDAMAIHLSVSIGFCLETRAPIRSGAALLLAAECAQEDAARNGPAAIRAYSQQTPMAPRSAPSKLEEQVDAALTRGEIIAYFQPQLSTDTGEVTGMEALARWNHPDRGVLPPAEFLPAIENGGLSDRLSEVILFQAFNAIRTWDRAGYAVPSVAVNFGKEQLLNPRLTQKLGWELDRFDLGAGRLTIEILETVIAETDNDTIVRNVAALAGMGCGIDLDDFGTGHASITSIRRFAVNRLKIDRSFVMRVDCDHDQQRMVAAILSMAEQLGLQTVAEGVESLAEHSMLAQLGCRHVQGFAIGRPMPLADSIGWLEKHQSRTAATPRLGRRTG